MRGEMQVPAKFSLNSYLSLLPEQRGISLSADHILAGRIVHGLSGGQTRW